MKLNCAMFIFPIATEPREGHGNIAIKSFIFPCFPVDSVAKILLIMLLEGNLHDI